MAGFGDGFKGLETFLKFSLWMIVFGVVGVLVGIGGLIYAVCK